MVDLAIVLTAFTALYVPLVQAGTVLSTAWELAFLFLVGSAYAIGFWSATGSSPGKAWFYARIATEGSGAPPSIGRSAARFLALFVSAIPLMAGFVWIAVDRRRRAWHDRIAGTVVPRDLPDPEPGDGGRAESRDRTPSTLERWALRIGVTLLVLASVASGAFTLRVLPDEILAEGSAAASALGLAPDYARTYLTYQLAPRVALLALVFGVAVVALAAIWRAGDSRAGRATAVFLAVLGCGLGNLGNGLAMIGAERAVPFYAWGLAFGLPAGLLSLARNFPSSLEPADLDERTWVARTADWLLPVHRPPSTRWLDERRIWGAALALAVTGAVALPDPSETVIAVVAVPILFLFVRAITLMRYNYRMADPRAQRQSLWAVQGVVGALMLFLGACVVYGFLAFSRSELVLAVGEGIAASLVFLSFASVLVGLSASIFYHGAIDPALSLRKTSLVGTLGLLALIVFAVAESFFSAYLVEWFGWAERWRYSGPMAGAVMAVVVGLFQQRVSARLDVFFDASLPATTLAEEGERAHRTVASCDLVGFTRLSSVNEEEALTLLTLLHQIVQREIRPRGGTVADSMGDTMLLEFDRPADAVAASRALIASYARACDRHGLDGLAVRIGVHAGTVVRDRRGRVLGDTVNRAWWLRDAAAGGEIWASEAVASESPDRWEAMGTRRFGDVVEMACFRMDDRAG